jgi:catalase
VLDRVVDNFFAETEQVAFCTQNIVPGIDFTDDPLLQGRNFSYLDTQLKRLGSPNFHEIPVNAPKGCPFHNFQQDGHMRMHVNRGRANYQPNSWGEGPRESPETGFVHHPGDELGPKLRIRAETFADHYSQAVQFYASQTEVEQAHIAAALTFELSKVETIAIRARMVAHLRNIDEQLASEVAAGLRLKSMPDAAPAAVTPRKDLAASPALSILLNGPESFAGRRIGVLVSDGADASLIDALQAAADEEGAMLKFVAPMVGGVEASDGRWIDAHEKIDGGPSVVFDAVALLPSDEGAKLLAAEPTARDFVADAFAHSKFIGYCEAAKPLLRKASVLDDMDEGCIALDAADDAAPFVQRCRKLRYWAREARVKQV